MERLCSDQSGDWLKMARKELSELAKGLSIEIGWIGIEDNGLVQVEFDGDDDFAFAEFLGRKYGSAPVRMSNIQRGENVQAVIIEAESTGLKVEIGVTEPRRIFGIVPISVLRAQLVDGGQVALDTIVQRYCLIEGFKISVRISSVSNGAKIFCTLSDLQEEIFKEWDRLLFQRILISSVFASQIEDLVHRKVVCETILKIEKIGMLNHLLTCKIGADSSRIITFLRRSFKNAKICVFSPSQAL